MKGESDSVSQPPERGDPQIPGRRSDEPTRRQVLASLRQAAPEDQLALRVWMRDIIQGRGFGVSSRAQRTISNQREHPAYLCDYKVGKRSFRDGTSALGAAQDSLETAPVAFSDGAIVCSRCRRGGGRRACSKRNPSRRRVRHRDKKQKAAKDVPRAGRLNVLDLLITCGSAIQASRRTTS